MLYIHATTTHTQKPIVNTPSCMQGLGKTIQTVSLVGLLAQHMAVRGPFLVVVPLSTVPNWIKEFKKWTPMVREAGIRRGMLGSSCTTAQGVVCLAILCMSKAVFTQPYPSESVCWCGYYGVLVSQVNTIMYVGDGRSREVIRAFEFPGAPSNRSRPYGFEVLITTYELVLKV